MIGSRARIAVPSVMHVYQAAHPTAGVGTWPAVHKLWNLAWFLSFGSWGQDERFSALFAFSFVFSAVVTVWGVTLLVYSSYFLLFLLFLSTWFIYLIRISRGYIYPEYDGDHHPKPCYPCLESLILYSSILFFVIYINPSVRQAIYVPSKNLFPCIFDYL